MTKRVRSDLVDRAFGLRRLKRSCLRTSPKADRINFEWYPEESNWKSCPVSSFVSEVRFRMAPEADWWTGDDTALNSIELKCKDINGCEVR